MRIVKSDYKDSPSTSQLECSIDTVDGRNPAITTWDVGNLVNNQLVIAGFLPLIVCFTAHFEIFGAPKTGDLGNKADRAISHLNTGQIDGNVIRVRGLGNFLGF